MLIFLGKSIAKTPLAAEFRKRAAQDGHVIIDASLDKFPSTELYTALRGVDLEKIKGQPAFLIESIAEVGDYHANDYFTELLMMGDTLQRYGAGPIWACTPFGPYGRADQTRYNKRNDTYESVGCGMAGKAMKGVGFKGLSTVEIHSEKAMDLLRSSFGKANVFSLDPTDVIVKDIQENILPKFPNKRIVVISPDKGANARADRVAVELGAERGYYDKKREAIVNLTIRRAGDINIEDSIVIAVDDMADSWGTMMKVSRDLKTQNPACIYAYAAHDVRSDPANHRLYGLIADGVLDGAIMMDTIDRSSENDKFKSNYREDVVNKVRHLSAGPMLYAHMNDVVAKHPDMQLEAG